MWGCTHFCEIMYIKVLMTGICLEIWINKKTNRSGEARTFKTSGFCQNDFFHMQITQVLTGDLWTGAEQAEMALEGSD